MSGPLRVALTSLGCKVNYAEMAELAGCVSAAGCEVVPDDQPADVRVLNSCTVTLRADATSRRRLRRLRREDPGAHIILTGCSVDGNPERYGVDEPGSPASSSSVPAGGADAVVANAGGRSAPASSRADPAGGADAVVANADGRSAPASSRADPAGGADAVVANADKRRIADHIIELARRRALSGGTAPVAGVPLSGSTPAATSAHLPLRARAFLKVQDGCDHRCTYCSVWRARGASTSVPAETVLARARQAAAAGHGEIVLCGVDLGSYGRDRTGALPGRPRAGHRVTTLAELIALLLRETDGVRFRLSSVNANDVGDDLLALNAHDRVCSHWHLPLQSGSDRVLRAMHRGYRGQQYRRVVGGLREADPRTELTTDVMVAFPGETPEDHRDTLDVIEEVGFLRCHVFRYSARPDTPAESLAGRVPDAVARRRSAEVRRAAGCAARLSLERGVGRIHEVVWDRVSSDAAHGISSTYHELVARPDAGTRPGAVQTVIAERVDGDHLAGAIV